MNTSIQRCQTCQSEFEALVGELKRGNGKYCSRSCSASRPKNDKKPNCTCAYCSKAFYRSMSKQQNSKSGLHFCNRKCKEDAQRIGDSRFDIIRPDHYNLGNRVSSYRSLAFTKLPNKCNRCGYNEYPVLQVHHLDRDRTNNLLSNLEILCPTCHETEHYLSRDGRWG